LAGVPSPTTVVGFETFSRPASAGISQCPSGLPAGGPSSKTGGSPPVEPELSEPPELPEPVVELSLPLVLSPPVEPVVPVVSSEPVLPVLPVPVASPLDDPHPEDVDPSAPEVSCPSPALADAPEVSSAGVADDSSSSAAPLEAAPSASSSPS